MFAHLADESITLQTIVTVLVYTGIRRGELSGLKWIDLDVKNKVMHIRRNLLYLPGRGMYEDTTKTSSSERAIKVESIVFQKLMEHRQEQNKQRIAMGDRWDEAGNIFTQTNGKPLHPDTITNTFRRFVEKHDLPYVSIHSLRHTNASLLIANGINLTTVASRLGHANTATTTKVYAHALKSADEIASGVIGNAIASAQEKVKKA